MGNILLGLLWGAVLYGLLAIKYWLPPRSESPDERIRSLARLNVWILGGAIGLLAFDYFYRETQSPAVLLAMIGALGGFQLGAEIHWQLAVGRHLRRKK
jgi:hypothetical protein